MSTQHTQGPWIENVVPTSAGSAITIQSADHRIAIIYVDGIRKGIDDELPRSIENRANARLIAAAPDLLEAAQRLASRGFFTPVACADEATLADMASMRAAIAKATGAKP
jgi:hypothetical protein